MKAIIINETFYRSLNAACKALEIPYAVVYGRMKRHNLSAQEAIDYYVASAPRKVSRYTDDELSIMRKCAVAGTPASLVADILGRTTGSVVRKASAEGISFQSVNSLTSDQVKFFKDNFGRYTYNQFSAAFNCSVSTVYRYAEELGLKKHVYQLRTIAALREVRKYAGKIRDFEIAGLTGLSINTVRRVARMNNISLACPDRIKMRPWTADEDRIIRSCSKKSESVELARMTVKRSYPAVDARMRALNSGTV